MVEKKKRVVKKKRSGPGAPSKYRDEFPEQLVEHMTKGLPFETFAATIGVDSDTLYRWREKHPEFGAAKKRGEVAAYLFYMKMGQGLALGKIKGNVTAWIFMMKNICKWRDVAKIETEQRALVEFKTTIDETGAIKREQLEKIIDADIATPTKTT